MANSVSHHSKLWRAITVPVVLLLSITWAYAADPTFAAKDLTSDLGVSLVLTADFNRDSISDIGTLGSKGFSVQLGKGDGTFGAPISTAIGSDSNIAVAGDVNGDGILDVVTGGDLLTVLLGNGDGSFRPAATLTGSSPGLADFNQDGKLDLAFVGSGTVNIALGNGDGTFGSPADVSPSGMFPSVGPLVTGDFDGDGIGDIAVANCCDPETEAAPIGHLYVLYGNGAGGIANTYSEQSASVAYLRTIDFNKDSIDDLAESWSGCHTPCMGLTVHLGNTSRQPSRYPAIEEPSFDTFVPGPGVAADFNGDGKNDIAFDDTDFFPMEVSAPRTNAVFVSLQQSDGSPAVTPLVFDIGTVTSIPKDIATADFNRDGKPDLVTLKSFDTLAVLLNTTGGSGSGGAGGGGGGTNQPADFSLSASPAQATVTAGGSATSTITVTGTNGFNSNVALTCVGLPAGATCTFAPATVTPGTSAAASQLTITTTGAAASLHRITGPWYGLWVPMLGLAFAGAGKANRKRLLVLLAALVMGLLLMQACGGSSANNSVPRGNAGGNGASSGGGGSSTQAGQYIVTVTGTSGSTHHTTAFTLTVQ